MRRVKMFGVALVMVSAVGIATVSVARAESTPLPLIHTALKGEVYPINLVALVEQEQENDIVLANANSKIPIQDIHLLLEAKELTALGQATIDFLGFHEEGGSTKCNTTGDSEGVVLFPDVEWHLVYTGLSPSEILQTAVLILFSKFIIICGGFLETVVEGPSLARLLDKPESGMENDSTDTELHWHCSNIANGIQEVSSYFNDKLELLTGQLLKVNIGGTGKANSCLEVKKTLLLEVEKGAAGGNSALMFTILL